MQRLHGFGTWGLIITTMKLFAQCWKYLIIRIICHVLVTQTSKESTERKKKHLFTPNKCQQCTATVSLKAMEWLYVSSNCLLLFRKEVGKKQKSLPIRMLPRKNKNVKPYSPGLTILSFEFLSSYPTLFVNLR